MVISIADMPEEEHFKRHFGSDQSVWRDGDWNGFVRIALAGLLDVRKRRGENVT